MANSLGRDIFNTFDELTFRLLATGALVPSQSLDLLNQSASLQSRSDFSLSIDIQSPTGLADDIIQASIDITMSTKKFTTAGVLDQEYSIIVGGSPTPGTTVILQYNDITRTLEIKVLRISGFIPTFEAVSQIVVKADYATLVRPLPERVPNHLISVKF
jgi:hypothetical protein